MFLPEPLRLRNGNSEYSSDVDSDYETSDCVQEEIFHGNPLYSCSMSSELEKEEILRRVLETKIGRYPLRQYINLSTGFDIHLRPNYYESDQEEEKEYERNRRRHSISAPHCVEDEEDGNLKISILRRYSSEGSAGTGYLWRKENEDVNETCSNLQINDLNAKSKDESEPDDLCITRTVTYTSKKQIIKFFQTEHLNVDIPQDRTVCKQSSAQKSYINKSSELNNTVNNLNSTTSKNEQINKIDSIKSKNALFNYKNNKYDCDQVQPSNVLDRTKCSPNLQFSDMRYKDISNIEREMEIIHGNFQGHNETEKGNTHSKSNEENYFFTQLGLKRQAQSKETCSNLSPNQILRKKNQETQTDGNCENITGFKNKFKSLFKDFSQFSFQNNAQQIYNINDLECKLKRVFGETNNKFLWKEVKNRNDQFPAKSSRGLYCEKASDLDRTKWKDKVTRYCYLHKQRGSFKNEKKRKSEKFKLRKESLSRKTSHNSYNDKAHARIVRKKIKVLKEKRRTLYEIKSVLRKVLCSEETCIKLSKLVPNTLKRKTDGHKSVKEEKQSLKPLEKNLKGKDHLIEEQSYYEKNKHQKLKNDLIPKRNEVTSLPQNINKSRMDKLPQIKRETELQNSNEKHSIQNVEIIEDCCCCSPSTSTTTILNKTEIKRKTNTTFSISAVSSSNDKLECVDLKASDNLKTADAERNDKNAGICSEMLLEDMFPDESEEDQDLQDLIAMLKDSIDVDPNPLSCQEEETGNKRIDHNSHTKLTPEDVPLDMTGMEHYKKRLIHQHEKPSGLSSPCTTTEEDDDSIESPLSPASSVQSRESCQQDKKRDEVVQKVARKRAVCRSQFRHQSMELFKLGSSIPTSLCKTKEPYNVCAEKNLQMCYQNGGLKKCDKNPSKGSLTESIINTIEGGKKKEGSLWRSVSLNNEISTSSNSNNRETKNSGNGRHILPAIVPELPERRKNRVKSLPENSSKSNNEIEKNNNSNEACSKSVYEFAENDGPDISPPVETISKKPTVKQKPLEESQESSKTQDITEARVQNPTASELDVPDCTPINLSLKKQDRPSWTDLFNIHHPKRNELNINQHLTHTILKQPSNVPTKPAHFHDSNVPRTHADQKTVISENLDSRHVDKDGNCFFVTAIPSAALDPQKQSNVIVINFPHIQQQMSRMEKPNVTLPGPPEAQQSPLEMLDSAIMSLINIVKSSVESAFNILSLPVLNRLYIDLSRYLLLPTVSVKMKACIEEALNALISYLLVNLFRTPRNSRARDFVHKMLQLDLRPHMDFLIHSLDVIQQKIKYEYFTDHLLKVLSHNPQEDFVMPLPRNVRRPFGDFPNVRPAPPPPHPFFPNQNQSSEFRDYPPNRFWMENQVYQHGNVAMPNMDFPQNQPHRRSRRQGDQESDKHLLASMRVPENFNEPNLVLMGPDLYLADNRCIPPNMSHIHPKALLNAPPQQPRSKGRPRNSSRINKMPKLSDNSLDLTVIPQTVKHRGTPEENKIFNHREKTVNIPNSNVSDARRAIRRHSDMIEESAHTRNRQQVLENRRLSEGAMIPNQAIENGVNVFSGNNFRMMTGTREVHKTVNGENDNYFRNNLMYAQQATANYDKNARIPRNNIRNYAETGSKHFPANVEAPTSGGNTVIVGNEIVQRKEQIGEFKTKNTPRIITKQCTGSDVEQYLQTNIIVNKYQATSVICEPVLKNLKPPTNTYDGSGTAVSNIGEKVVNIEKFHRKGSNFETNVYKNHIPNTIQASRTAESETVEKQSGYDKQREESRYSSKAKADKPDVPEVIANTVIIKDKSMEISKGAGSSSAVTNTMDLDDVVLEQVSPTGDLKHGISYTTSRGEGPPKVITDGGNYQERLSLVTDVSIEKITDEYDVPPKLIKLATLKRKTAHDERQQRKLVKRWPSPKEMTGGDIVVIEDEEKIKELKKLDCNQNDVTKTEKFSRKPITDAINSVVASNTSINKDKSNKPTVSGERSNVKPVPPMIEDISSEEEVLEPFRLYSTYDNKVPGDPRKILQTMEVSHCTLIEGNVKAIQDANRHLFEKPPVYTRPVMPPRNLRKPPAEDNPANRKEPLANLVQFKEDSDTLTCSLKVKNSELKYPSNMDVRRFSPGAGYQVAAEDVSPIRSPKFSPNFKSPPRPTNAPSAVVQMSHMVPRPPIAQAPAAVPVVQTSPVPSKSPAVRMSPVPVIPKLAIDRTSPAVRQVSPRLPGPPPLNESNMNWGHWFSEEQRKGVFNFERSQSMESSTLSGRQSAEALSSAGSDYCSKFSPEEPLCEIKIDSKPYRIKKSVFEKIPKGKLCYIRESNSFVRYFDDKQMELFISNLNLGEGSTVASDLLKQIRSRGEGPASVGSPTGHYETSGKGEVITLSKDVVFSSEDFLSDPEQYVEEVEKVQRYVPKDFYGFYKFVTGYQIVNHHPPISFLTFLTMHNTNGIRGLFKNYVNTLAEGRSIL